MLFFFAPFLRHKQASPRPSVRGLSIFPFRKHSTPSSRYNIHTKRGNFSLDTDNRHARKAVFCLETRYITINTMVVLEKFRFGQVCCYIYYIHHFFFFFLSHATHSHESRTTTVEQRKRATSVLYIRTYTLKSFSVLSVPSYTSFWCIVFRQSALCRRRNYYCV